MSSLVIYALHIMYYVRPLLRSYFKYSIKIVQSSSSGMRKGFISAVFDFQRPFKHFGNWNNHYRLEACWKDTLETSGFTLHSYRKKSFRRIKRKRKKGTLLSGWESLYWFFSWPGLLLEEHCNDCNGYLDFNVITSRKWIFTFLVNSKSCLFFFFSFFATFW